MCSFNVNDFLNDLTHRRQENCLVLLCTYFWWLRKAPRLGAFFPHSLQMCSDSASKCLAIWPRKLFWCFSLESEIVFFCCKNEAPATIYFIVNYHAEHTVHWTLVASSPVCCNRCCCKHCLLLNVFAHTSHIKTLLLLWTPLICDWRIDFVINDFGQCSQMNFFSSEKWRCFWCWESWYRLTKL